MSMSSSTVPGVNGDLPEIISAFDMCAANTPLPPEVVGGILHKGSKMVLGGGSKSFKTWTLLEMAICVASGTPWLNQFPTVQGRVIYLNFEIQRCFTEQRVRTICDAMRVDIPKNLEFWNLRGHSCAIQKLIPKITERLKGEEYLLLTLDPLYKLLGDKSENVTEDIAHVMNEVERLAVDLGPAVNFGSHFSKGNQAAKEAIDRISGSGVFARDPDSILTMTEHEEKDAFVVDLILRNFPPVDSFVVRRNHPLMRMDASLNANDIKQKANTAKVTDEQCLACLVNNSLRKDWWENFHRQFPKVSEDTFDRRRDSLVKNRKIFKSEIDHKYTRL